MTLVSPHRLLTRARVIMAACGGQPDQDALANPTPHTVVARHAYWVIWYAHHARFDLRFLRETRGRPANTLAWHYGAYAFSRKRARVCIRAAGERLAKAEVGFEALR